MPRLPGKPDALSKSNKRFLHTRSQHPDIVITRVKLLRTCKNAQRGKQFFSFFRLLRMHELRPYQHSDHLSAKSGLSYRRHLFEYIRANTQLHHWLWYFPAKSLPIVEIAAIQQHSGCRAALGNNRTIQRRADGKRSHLPVHLQLEHNRFRTHSQHGTQAVNGSYDTGRICEEFDVCVRENRRPNRRQTPVLARAADCRASRRGPSVESRE